MSNEQNKLLEEVIQVTKDIVKAAMASDTLWKWTKGSLRLEIATRLGVDISAIASNDQYKNAIKAANEAAQLEYQEEHPEATDQDVQGGEGQIEAAVPKKAKKVEQSKVKARKRKSDAASASASPPAKKKKATNKAKISRSASVVLSANEESASKSTSTTEDSTPSNAPKSMSRIITSDDETGLKEETKVQDSETELEDLIDEEPTKRKRKPKDADKDKDIPSTKKRRAKKEGGSEDKNDQEIKRLKGLIAASGHRKPYTKLFSSLPDPTNKRAQIKLLRDILIKECEFPSEGRRWSLKLAKELKEKRDFEKELEDVKEFEKAITSRSTRASRTSDTISGSFTADAMDDDEDQEAQPTKRRSTARQSIMAFLADQSESE